MSIYTKLFSYRPRPTRRPREDFLSAALADILNRLPRETSISFVTDILLAGHAKQQLWLKYIEASPSSALRWTTQIGVRHRQAGIVDLLLRVDGQEAIVIENKIGALVRAHDEDGDRDAEPPIGDATADANQLRTYGHWLATRCQGKPWPGALILLTHYTVAPADFGGRTPGDYGVPILQVCRWDMIWRWARNITPRSIARGDFDNRPTWISLCHELAEFLEDQNMVDDFMTLHDLAVLQIFVDSAARVNATFAAIRAAVVLETNGLAHGHIRSPEYDSEACVAWSWFYIQTPSIVAQRWHFGWGIRFPQLSQWWLGCESLPRVPHAFLTLTTDEVALPLTDIDIPVGWVVTPEEGDLVIAKPMHEFPADAEAMTAAFSEWVATSLRSARPMLTALTNAAGA